MNYFATTSYWGTLVPNAESVAETTNPYSKNIRAPYVTENESQLVLFFKINMLQYPFDRIRLKDMRKFVSEILKRTRSGKPYAEEASHIE